MALYNIKNQWGGDTAPWKEGGKWILGTRDDQGLLAVNIQSSDRGETFVGTMVYEGERSIDVKAKRLSANTYEVENHWGEASTPWHPAGQWIIGMRSGQPIIALNIESTDNGNTLSGTMTYDGEGPIGFQASCSPGDVYAVKNQWGEDNTPWHEGGSWALGCRQDQRVVALDISSSDGGKTLVGTMRYSGEGDIGFKGNLIGVNNYQVENQWAGDNSPWHQGGLWIIGFRESQLVTALKLNSDDDGDTLQGEMTYTGEGEIQIISELLSDEIEEIF